MFIGIAFLFFFSMLARVGGIRDFGIIAEVVYPLFAFSLCAFLYTLFEQIVRTHERFAPLRYILIAVLAFLFFVVLLIHLGFIRLG